MGRLNRLAAALSLLAILIGPPTFMYRQASEVGRVVQIGIDACIASVQRRIDNDPADASAYEDRTECIQQRTLADYGWSWANWRDAVAATAMICAVVYGVLAGLFLLFRWVWRGDD